MSTFSIKKFTSLLLSLSIAMSFIVFLPSAVNADDDDSIQLDTVYDIVLEDCNNYYGNWKYIFKYNPDEDGYYLLEDSISLYVLVENEFGGLSEYRSKENTYAFNLPEIINYEYLYRKIYYFEAGQDYYISAYDHCRDGQLCLRKADEYLSLSEINKEIQAEKDSTFTCEIDIDSSIDYDICSIRWADSNSGYSEISNNGLSITLNSNDYIDFDDPYCLFGETYNTLICDICFIYNDEEYNSELYFYLIPYDFSSDCWAEGNYTEYSCPYYKDNDYSRYFKKTSFKTYARSSKDCDISYQWYEIDSYKESMGIEDKDELYICLNGQTSDTLQVSDVFDEPYTIYGENSFSVIKQYCCIVTFNDGNESVEKEVIFNIHFYVQPTFSYYKANYSLNVKIGNEIQMPGKVEINDIILPDGISYQYSWYNLNSSPESLYIDFLPENDSASNYLSSDWNIIGSGKNPTIDTSNLTFIDEDGISVSYIACVFDPIYDDDICYGCSCRSGYYFFKLISIDSLPFDEVVYAESVKEPTGWLVYNEEHRIHGEWYNSQYCEVSASCDLDSECNISYQWYKIDSYKEIAGITDRDELYIPLEGETSNKFTIWDDTAEPYIYAIGDQFYIVKKIICEVTFDNGDKVVKKEVPFEILYHAQVNYIYHNTPTINVINGDDITFEVDNCFVPTDLPDGVTFKYSWINLKNLSYRTTQSTQTCSTRSIWEGKFISRDDYVILCNKDSITLNSSDLIWFENNGERYSYVVCISEPLYNGNPIYGYSLANGYQVFKVVEDTDHMIISQPEDYYSPVGNTATFRVGTRGEGLNYQWQVLKNGVWKNTSLTGYNTPSLSVGITDARNGMKFRCVVSDTNGNTEYSREATIFVVKQGPEIIDQPVDFTGSVGETAVFTVNAEGDALTYQWQVFKNGVWKNTSLTGCNTASLSVGITEARNGMKFRCLVYDAIGFVAESSAATINVVAGGPEIKSQPEDYNGSIGETAVFTVSATGEELTYQWQVYKNGVWKNTSLNGNKTDALEVGIIESRDGMKFHCVVTDINGKSVTSDEATLTVSIPAITITSEPEDYSGSIGETAVFTVSAEGEELTYQWQVYKSGAWKNTSLTGNKTDTLEVGIIESRDGMKFRCVVTDINGKSVTSGEATITISVPATSITSEPEDYSGSIGDTAVFTVSATGEDLTYQWQVYKNGAWKNTSLAGNTTDTLEVGIIESRDGMTFRCVIKDGNNNKVISNEVMITVDKGPEIIIQPEDYSGDEGDTAVFSVKAEGNDLTYQWQVYKNGAWKNTSLAGNTTDTLEVGVIESRDGMQFRCVIKDGNNNKVISDEVTVSIWLYS
jgi:hypothetical protein